MRRKKPSKALFIEGESSEAKASLKQGFNKLFSQLLAGNMPKIYMGDGISTTIRKFKVNKREGTSFLLVDLDTIDDNIEERIAELELGDYSENVFWMVQEMEAWFISQPDVIDKIYGRGVSKKMTKKKPQLFEKPSLVLMDITRKTRKGPYHKVTDAVDFLENLNAAKLELDFPQFAKLMEKLRK